MTTKQKQNRRLRIKYRIRKRLSGTAERPRMSVFRSNTAMYVQLIDDVQGRTLVSASTKQASSKKSVNIEDAKTLGKQVAEKAVAQGITSVVFDRNGYLYHGKVKAVADAAREGGLKL
jgi:large subunit ribosomal protein L18